MWKHKLSKPFFPQDDLVMDFITAIESLTKEQAYTNKTARTVALPVSCAMNCSCGVFPKFLALCPHDGATESPRSTELSPHPAEVSTCTMVLSLCWVCSGIPYFSDSLVLNRVIPGVSQMGTFE